MGLEQRISYLDHEPPFERHRHMLAPLVVIGRRAPASTCDSLIATVVCVAASGQVTTIVAASAIR
jgi:hypothetical protein